MVPWGTGNPISSGYLNTLVFLTEKPPPLSVSEGGGSMSQEIREEIKIAESYLYWKRKDAYRERQHVKHELERTKTDLIEEGYGEDRADEISAEHDLFLTGNLYEEYFKDIDEAEEDLKTLRIDREIYKKFLEYIRQDN